MYYNLNYKDIIINLKFKKVATCQKLKRQKVSKQNDIINKHTPKKINANCYTYKLNKKNIKIKMFSFLHNQRCLKYGEN